VTIVFNGRPTDLAPEATVADLLLEHRGVAVALNGEVVPRDRHAATPLTDGDVVEVVTAVQGG
jgi:sulfur carrier protein